MRGSSEISRDEIVALAADLFLEKGYAATSLEDFAKAANVSPESIRETIGQKEELIALIVRRITGEVKLSVCDIEKGSRTTREYLTEVAEVYLGQVCKRRAIRAFQYTAGLAVQFPHISTQFKVTIGEVAKNFGSRLQEQTVISLPDGQDHVDAAAQFFALCRGIFHLQLIFDIEYVVSEREIKAQAEKAVTTFLRAFPVLTE